MLIVADENMALVEPFFGHLGELRCYAGRQLTAEQVQDADVLLVRSVTKVNADLLAKSRVRFVGSATIGADHLDLPWLAAQDIFTTTAPGCNARSVVEYVISALLTVSQRLGIALDGRVLGIVGLGNVGYLLARVAQSIGLKVIACDPFVTRTEIQQVDFAELIAMADIVSLHTPLTQTGSHPSYHLVNARSLARMKSGSILLNTGRGAVVDNQALLQILKEKPTHLAAVVLDVWEGEPLVSQQLLSKVTIATPHIAGYSLEGKWRGTEQIYNVLCQFLGLAPQHRLADFLPQQKNEIEIVDGESAWTTAQQLVAQAYPIMNDDAAFRATMSLAENERALAFDGLRKHYWPRREFAAYQLAGQFQSTVSADLSKKLGFLH